VVSKKHLQHGWRHAANAFYFRMHFDFLKKIKMHTRLELFWAAKAAQNNSITV
jgi:hypothetical protein